MLDNCGPKMREVCFALRKGPLTQAQVITGTSLTRKEVEDTLSNGRRARFIVPEGRRGFKTYRLDESFAMPVWWVL